MNIGDKVRLTNKGSKIIDGETTRRQKQSVMKTSRIPVYEGDYGEVTKVWDGPLFICTFMKGEGRNLFNGVDVGFEMYCSEEMVEVIA